MKISDVQIIRFKTTTNTERDSDGHGHLSREREVVQNLLKIISDEDICSY